MKPNSKAALTYFQNNEFLGQFLLCCEKKLLVTHDPSRSSEKNTTKMVHPKQLRMRYAGA
jgi:hypothetical protein